MYRVKKEYAGKGCKATLRSPLPGIGSLIILDTASQEALEALYRLGNTLIEKVDADNKK